jgi:subtilisin family serine protease
MDQRAWFSNYGTWIDISAPGVDVVSTVRTTEGTYRAFSGTSMACPHIAGVLALGLGIGIEKTRSETLACLFSSVNDLGGMNAPKFVGKVGAGLVDAHQFVLCMKLGSPTPQPTYSQRPTLLPTSSQPTVRARRHLRSVAARGREASLAWPSLSRPR